MFKLGFTCQIRLDLIFIYNGMGNYNIYLGAAGWNHPGWSGIFYPEGLPEDWQLSFYNTQFRCVYLPYDVWRNATDEEVASWLSETRNEFRFVLQLPVNITGNDMSRICQFGARGIAESQAELFWLEGAPDLRNLAYRMQTATRDGMPLYLISLDGDLTRMRQVSELMELLGV